ncbi:alpha/beta fold hydrolase [Sediminicurvatus halobius]|uniref:Alpha/beta hydrolase n=1 Tax=Sediminicurvatus halobius TaxID=2182432 RepID=A0A2U2MVZ1_9GAMM|nr:alpha/beta hydrolase [Spiribacter halobius]PWG61028.1 alpha/beta hydrolase [Spiribacter halobius]UEX77419.1 alpha/beta hydrolase [Spiribacter halobius]
MRANDQRPRLVFAHANGFPAGSYRRFLAALETAFRVEAPERLGHDPAYPVGLGWPTLAEELLERISAGGSERTWLVGHSLGGVLAFLAALRQPRRLHGFVMLDPPLVFGWRGPALATARRLGLIDRLTPAGRSQGRRSRWPDAASAAAHFRSRALFRDFDAEAIEDYVAAGTVADGDGVRLAYDPAVEVEIFRQLPAWLHREPAPVPVPGAVLTARGSTVTHRGDLARFRRHHGVAVHEVPGGHLFPLERPGEAAEAVQAAVRGLQGQRQAG